MADENLTPPVGTETTVTPPASETPPEAPKGSILTGNVGDPPAQTVTTPDWLKTLPEEFQEQASLKTYKDLPSFVKSALEAEKLIGKKGIVKPGENATPEELDRYYKDLGRPDKPEEYSFKKPADWPENVPFAENMIPKVQEIFHKRGIPADQAQGIWNDYHEVIKSEYEQHAGVSEKQVQEGLAALKQEWGGEEKYAANIETAKIAVREFGGDGLVDFLNTSGLGDHPALIKAFANAGKGLREDGFVGNTSSSSTNTVEGAKAEIEKLSNDHEFTKILYSNDLQNKNAKAEATRRWESLHKIAFPTFTTK
jgi:hypothetical protein